MTSATTLTTQTGGGPVVNRLRRIFRRDERVGAPAPGPAPSAGGPGADHQEASRDHPAVDLLARRRSAGGPAESGRGKRFANPTWSSRSTAIRPMPNASQMLLELTVKANDDAGTEEHADTDAFGDVYRVETHRLQLEIIDSRGLLVPWFPSGPRLGHVATHPDAHQPAGRRHDQGTPLLHPHPRPRERPLRVQRYPDAVRRSPVGGLLHVGSGQRWDEDRRTEPPPSMKACGLSRALGDASRIFSGSAGPRSTDRRPAILPRPSPWRQREASGVQGAAMSPRSPAGRRRNPGRMPVPAADRPCCFRCLYHQMFLYNNE